MKTMPVKKNKDNNISFINNVIMKDIVEKKKLLLIPSLIYNKNVFSVDDMSNSDNSSLIQNIIYNSSPFINKTSSLDKFNNSETIHNSNSIKSIDSISSYNSFINRTNTNDTIETYKSNNSEQNNENVLDSEISNDDLIDNSNDENNYSDDEIIKDTKQILTLSNNIKVNNENKENKENKENNENNKNDENIYNLTNDDFYILSNLTLLTKIQPNQKLLVQLLNKNDEKTKFNKINFEFKIDNSYIPKLTRWYKGQGRNETFNAINDLIDISIKQCEIYKNNNMLNFDKYYNLLNNCKLGLCNLKLTYKSDNLIIQIIDNILTKINTSLNTYSN
jgi:hypothetical protein